MSKEKVCPYDDDFNKCPHVQQAKEGRKKKPERIPKVFFETSDKKENCTRCNVIIPKNIRFVLEKVYEDRKLVEENIVCASCMKVEKL